MSQILKLAEPTAAEALIFRKRDFIRGLNILKHFLLHFEIGLTFLVGKNFGRNICLCFYRNCTWLIQNGNKETLNMLFLKILHINGPFTSLSR